MASTRAPFRGGLSGADKRRPSVWSWSNRDEGLAVLVVDQCAQFGADHDQAIILKLGNIVHAAISIDFLIRRMSLMRIW